MKPHYFHSGQCSHLNNAWTSRNKLSPAPCDITISKRCRTCSTFGGRPKPPTNTPDPLSKSSARPWPLHGRIRGPVEIWRAADAHLLAPMHPDRYAEGGEWRRRLFSHRFRSFVNTRNCVAFWFNLNLLGINPIWLFKFSIY